MLQSPCMYGRHSPGFLILTRLRQAISGTEEVLPGHGYANAKLAVLLSTASGILDDIMTGTGLPLQLREKCM